MIAVLLTALGINALLQVTHVLPGWGNDPALLSAEQLVVGLVGVAAGVAAWRHHASAWILAIGWGVVTCVLLLSLPPLLDLAPEEAVGIWYGSLIIVGLTVGIAWYLRRVLATSMER